MKTYSTKSNAARAARKALTKDTDAVDFVVMPAPEKGWFFELQYNGGTSEEQDTGSKPASNRGGGKQFMTGRYVRNSDYGEETVGSIVFRVCDMLAERMHLMDSVLPEREARRT